MKEGTVPVPLYRPCAESDDDELPVQELSHLGGRHSGGGMPKAQPPGASSAVCFIDLL